MNDNLAKMGLAQARRVACVGKRNYYQPGPDSYRSYLYFAKQIKTRAQFISHMVSQRLTSA